MILPLNKYNLEDLSNTKFYNSITEFGKINPKYILDFKNITLLHTFCMKNNPKYVKSSKNHTLSDQFYMNLIPYSRYAHTVLDCEKRPFLCEFLDEPDTPSWHSSAPWAVVAVDVGVPLFQWMAC